MMFSNQLEPKRTAEIRERTLAAAFVDEDSGQLYGMRVPCQARARLRNW